MSTSFADLGVSAEAVRSLRARGITFPFPIQAQAIPPALAGEDVCGRAPTGSGKTIAFGLPIAARVERAGPGRPRALILAPTRELAAQIQAEMTLLMGTDRRRRVAAFYGGVGFGSQLDALRRGVDVAVACPGRLADLVRRGAVSLSDVAMVVIDEADRMADMGFLPEVKRILDQVRADRQTLLFSATLDGEVDVLVRRYQQSPVKISVGADSASVGSATHHWVDTPREEQGRHGGPLREDARLERGVLPNQTCDRSGYQAAGGGGSQGRSDTRRPIPGPARPGSGRLLVGTS